MELLSRIVVVVVERSEERRRIGERGNKQAGKEIGAAKFGVSMPSTGISRCKAGTSL